MNNIFVGTVPFPSCSTLCLSTERATIIKEDGKRWTYTHTLIQKQHSLGCDPVLTEQTTRGNIDSSAPVYLMPNFSGEGPLGSYPSVPFHSCPKATLSSLTLHPQKLSGLTGHYTFCVHMAERDISLFLPSFLNP